MCRLFLPPVLCKGRGDQQQDYCVSHHTATQNRENSTCSEAVPTMDCSWQSTINTPSFSFLSSLSHPTRSDDLLAALTVALKSSPFDFQGVQILSSPDEEAFNWVAVNYVLENFFKVKDF